MSLIKRIDVQNLRQTEWEISKGVLAAGAFCAPLAELQETTFKDFVKGPLTNLRESVTQFASTFDGNRLGYYLEGGRGHQQNDRFTVGLCGCCGCCGDPQHPGPTDIPPLPTALSQRP